MARSPFTLAAAVTAAIAGAQVTGVRTLTAAQSGRFDSAVVQLDDGRTVVLRASTDDESATELRAEAVALQALSGGVRTLLPFAAPEYLGTTRLLNNDSTSATALVSSYVPGYQVLAEQIIPGDPLTQAVGSALAAVHSLPLSIVRLAGLAESTADQVRADQAKLADRAASTGYVPARLTVRWRAAVNDDELWRFEPTITLGTVSSRSFLWTDDPEWGPRTSGVIGWHGLGINDPAADLAWLASAPQVSEEVFVAYEASNGTAHDPALRSRARLAAELEFAKWLLHGIERKDQAIIADATQLLESLADNLHDADLAVIRAQNRGVEQALAALESVPESIPATGITAMQTDTYRPEDLWPTAPAAQPDLAVDPAAGRAGGTTIDADQLTEEIARMDGEETAPLPNFVEGLDVPAESSLADQGESPQEPQRAARAALKRWLRPSSE